MFNQITPKGSTPHSPPLDINPVVAVGGLCSCHGFLVELSARGAPMGCGGPTRAKAVGMGQTSLCVNQPHAGCHRPLGWCLLGGVDSTLCLRSATDPCPGGPTHRFAIYDGFTQFIITNTKMVPSATIPCPGGPAHKFAIHGRV